LVTEYKAFSVVMTSRYAKDNADQFHPVSNKDQNGAYGYRMENRRKRDWLHPS